jgi:purine-binding chemotaxis protein CheW
MSGGLSLVLVRMGGRPCAIPCGQVVEIVPRVNLDRIPDAPAAVLGVMNLRGKVVPVMDVRAHVSGQPTHSKSYQHLVVVQAGTKQVGLVVDDVHEVLEVAEQDIEKPGDLTGVKSPGVVRVENDMVLVISPEDVIHAVG